MQRAWLIEALDKRKHERGAFSCGKQPLDDYLKKNEVPLTVYNKKGNKMTIHNETHIATRKMWRVVQRDCGLYDLLFHDTQIQ